MTLPLINVFETPYECWETRQPSPEEFKQHLIKTGQMLYSVEEKLKCKVSTHFEAASYIVTVGADNGLENFIDDRIEKSPAYKAWRKSMPSKTPEAISEYQKRYSDCDLSLVAKEIEVFGIILSEGNFLFHGGFWPDRLKSVFTTNRPFSTSFCPQVALRNAEWKGKAYDSGEVHLFVLKVVRIPGVK